MKHILLLVALSISMVNRFGQSSVCKIYYDYNANGERVKR